MRLRGKVKKVLFGAIPFVRGKFPYYGQSVFFPLGSHVFERACAEGIYEQDILNVVLSLIVPGTTYIDVGANIGLMSIPPLCRFSDINVISVEASPLTLAFLRQTYAASPHRNRWTIVEAAVAAECGETDFCCGNGANGAFDGIYDTGRGGTKKSTRVPIRTLDAVWRVRDRPDISVIKMDIEGGECVALRGAREMISATRPALLIEWNRQNLAANGVKPEELFRITEEINYSIYDIPELVPATIATMLKLMMNRTETFLLLPRETTR